MTTNGEWPSVQEHYAYEYQRFERALDRVSSDLVGNHIAKRMIQLMDRHATPTEMIKLLREMADQLEETGIR